MGEQIRSVGIGEMVVSANPDEILTVYGLGSCVVVCLYDPLVRTGGMLHALLPTPTNNHKAADHLAKYVDQGIPRLIEALVAQGASPARLMAYLCGGAQVLTTSGFEDSARIGPLNVRAARMTLRGAGLKLQAAATGGYHGRTVRFYLANGWVTVRTVGQPERILTRSKHVSR